MPFSTIATPEAKPVANYKMATRQEGGQLLYISGQVARDTMGTSSAKGTCAPKRARSFRTSGKSCRRLGVTSKT